MTSNNKNLKRETKKQQSIVSGSENLINGTNDTPFYKKILNFFGSFSLVQLTIISALLGVVFGVFARKFDPNDDVLTIIGAPGMLFINSLKLIVVPFIAVIMLRVPMDLGEISKAKKIASKVLCYYLSTTFIASLVGLMFYNLVKPGSRSVQGCPVKNILSDINALDKFTAIQSIINIGSTAIPSNLFKSFVETNILGVLTFFLFYGFVLLKYKDTRGGRLFKEILDTMYQVFMDLIKYIINLTPIGVFSLISVQITKLKSFCIIYLIGIYILTLIAALFFQIIIVYQLIYIIFTRHNSIKYYKFFVQPTITAFVSASSAAALPFTMRAADNAGVDQDVSRFVLPLGATVNMDGSAIYYPITVLFLASLQGLSFGFGKQIMIAIISGIVTIGGAPIPSGALVFLIVVLEATGIPIMSQISYIWAFDWFMDRCLTSTNVFGDAVGAGIIDKILKDNKSIYSDIHGTETVQIVKERRLSNSTYSYAKKLAKIKLKKVNVGKSDTSTDASKNIV